LTSTELTILLGWKVTTAERNVTVRRWFPSGVQRIIAEISTRRACWRRPRSELCPSTCSKWNYTLDGIRGVKANGGSARVAAATELIESVGGKLESFNFAFGATDVYVIADFPDNVSAAAAAFTVCAGGGATARTVLLLTAAEVDAAAAKNSTYRPPAG
jgi:uncharacterized protein with GYD domain